MIRKIILILIAAAFLYSCIDEPTIEPTPLPYTSVRLGNFSANVDAINVTIDGEQSFNIEKGNLTNYFDLVSGKREFVVTNAANSEIILDTTDIEITSYEELAILFSGYSAPGDEFNNSFGNFNFTEGVVYLLEEAEEGRVRVTFLNLISDTPDTTSIDVSAILYDVSGDSTQTIADAIALNEATGLQVEEGPKMIYVTNSDDTDTLLTQDVGNIEAGYQYFIFITGTVENIETVVSRRAPLDVRDK